MEARLAHFYPAQPCQGRDSLTRNEEGDVMRCGKQRKPGSRRRLGTRFELEADVEGDAGMLPTNQPSSLPLANYPAIRVLPASSKHRTGVRFAVFCVLWATIPEVGCLARVSITAPKGANTLRRPLEPLLLAGGEGRSDSTGSWAPLGESYAGRFSSRSASPLKLQIIASPSTIVSR